MEERSGQGGGAELLAVVRVGMDGIGLARVVVRCFLDGRERGRDLEQGGEVHAAGPLWRAVCAGGEDREETHLPGP